MDAGNEEEMIPTDKTKQRDYLTVSFKRAEDGSLCCHAFPESGVFDWPEEGLSVAGNDKNGYAAIFKYHNPSSDAPHQNITAGQTVTLLARKDS